MSPANLLRRNRALERRASRAWALYVTGWLCMTGAAAFLVLSVFVAALGWGWRFWR